MENRKIIIVLLAIVLVATISYAFKISGFNYKISGIITAGSIDLSGDNYKAKILIDQPSITNEISSKSFKACIGAGCYLFEPPYQIVIKGKIIYENGTVVSDAEIKAIINYGTYNYEKTNKTDSNGNFVLEVRIPEFLSDRNFNVKIYEKDEIEAFYECIYNKESDWCS